MLKILEKLVWFRTTADDKQSIFESLDYVSSYLIARGMYVRRYESNGQMSLVATLQPDVKKTKVMLAAHIDVIPAAEEMFTVRKADGRLYGRGTLDMKFAIAAYMQLVDDLQNNLNDYDFGIMITSDEEFSGLDGTPKLLEEGYVPDVCILPDGGQNWQIQKFSKGVLFLTLKSYGTTAHGSRPWLGQNAITPLLHAIVDIQTIFEECSEDSCTLNLGKVEGGNTFNQVPDYAEALLDIRYTSDSERNELMDKIQGACVKYGVEVVEYSDGNVASLDLSNHYIATFARIITQVTGVEVVGSRTSGSNDARFFTNYDVPCISVYPAGAGHHGPNEYIEEEAFYQFKDIVRQYLDEIARISP